MQKSIPLSVRVSREDAEFLAKIEVQDARTPSDKLRSILAAARRRHESAQDFPGCAEMIGDMLRPSLQRVREAQRGAHMRSDFVGKLYDRLPELMAELIAGAPDANAGPEALKRFEAALADQIFALIEEILNLGLTSRDRSYQPGLLQQKMNPVLEIAELIKQSRNQTSGEVE